ncbi:preprotein translocase subunit SecG [Planobacterium oryzisoli]|uniref:Protein-export membrane protein SecG n=1 Tax=Planobacterium oryzisoli TaxID=2771435 RepID=A0A930YVJ7_9FLAO|nr:preprotein translocase subunit SecG [Planobacterium oryzisoli]MBF5027123.1 preprotein translocase subunit SecG [Planobacterium oryzisoli]
MSTIFTLFMILIIIASILLIIIIMAQNPKGGGLSGTFGGSGAAQFGVQRTNDFMEKATWTLGITIVVLIVLSVVLTAKPVRSTAPALQNTPAQSAPVQSAPVQSAPSTAQPQGTTPAAPVTTP